MDQILHHSGAALALEARQEATPVSPKVYTLAVVRKGSGVFLGWKKRGFGVGRLMGFGGKVEPGETVNAAARREVQEECGILATKMQKRAEITFHFEQDPRPWLVHVFDVSEYEGQPAESDEMRPQFFEASEIPMDSMFPDDPFWLPPLLRGDSLLCEFWVSKDGSQLFQHDVQQLEKDHQFRDQ